MKVLIRRRFVLFDGYLVNPIAKLMQKFINSFDCLMFRVCLGVFLLIIGFIL